MAQVGTYIRIAGSMGTEQSCPADEFPLGDRLRETFNLKGIKRRDRRANIVGSFRICMAGFILCFFALQPN